MESEVIKAITELKVEVWYIWKTLAKVEKVLENQWVFEEKLNVANKRIEKIEVKIEKNQDNEKIKDVLFNDKIRKLEDWKIKLITLAWWVASVVWFLASKLF